MDKQMLVIEMPDLDDEMLVQMQDFLQGLINSFEAHYYHRLERYYRKKHLKEMLEDQF